MPVEKALRKFRSMCKKEGIINEMKKRRAYEKPSSRDGHQYTVMTAQCI